MLDYILNLALPKELIIILVGAMPIFELRMALPVAINVFSYQWYYALFLSVVGNLLPVPFLLLFWEGLSRFLNRMGIFQRPLDWLFERTRRQSINIGKYKFWGLLVFVAIPVPFTGAWTASLVAVVLGMKFWSAFWAIFGGVFVAGVIVMVLSLMGWFGAAIAIIGLTCVTIWSLMRSGQRSVNVKESPKKLKP
jgi:uncharacterized membrane protein